MMKKSICMIAVVLAATVLSPRWSTANIGMNTPIQNEVFLNTIAKIVSAGRCDYSVYVTNPTVRVDSNVYRKPDSVTVSTASANFAIYQPAGVYAKWADYSLDLLAPTSGTWPAAATCWAKEFLWNYEGLRDITFVP
jgi:hypothetical protein